MERELLLQDILKDAKIGWWEADADCRTITLSEYLKKTLGFASNTISWESFVEKIDASHRGPLVENIFNCDMEAAVYEQLIAFTQVSGKEKETYQWKTLHCRKSDGGGCRLSGYARRVETADGRGDESYSVERMNSLLYQLNSISHTLLSFLHTSTIDDAVHEVLSEVLTMFQGSRTYIVELDWENDKHHCAYEVVAKGVEGARNDLNQLSLSETPWWIEQLQNATPIILSTLDDLPPEAAEEHHILGLQDIQSLFVLPLLSRDKVWGYVGIDVVGSSRQWHEEDYQWFTSLVNIINICIELQRSEKKAQTERDYLQNLYRYMPLGYIRIMLIFDSNGEPCDYHIVDSNYAAEKIIGMSQSQYVGKRASELKQNFVEGLRQDLELIRAEHYIEREAYIETSGKHVHTSIYSPQPDELICLLTDTTEMNRAHNTLDRQEKLLRNIYNNIPVGIELYDKDGYLVEINKKDMEIFGVRSKEDLGDLNFYQNPIVPKEYTDSVRRGEDISFKLLYPFNNLGGYYESSKTGYLEIYTTVSMLYDAQGELINFMLINIDNTEINRAHSRIAEFESSFSLVSRFGRVGYCRCDLLTNKGFAMPQWYRNLGESEDKPLDQVINVYTYVEASHRKALIEALCDMRDGRIDNYTSDLQVFTPDGLRWTRVNIITNPMNNDPGKREVISVSYDITELKQTENNLIEAKNKAEVSDRLKSAFLANMSHEIRTPLNAIVGFSNLLMETNDPEEREDFMRIVHENNELLLKLISDILDLSKIEAGTLEFTNAKFDVIQMCREIVKSMGIKVNAKPVEMRLAEGLQPCCLVSDKNRLMQVLTNFINNALKFTARGSITLGYSYDEQQELIFYVEDTGAGIPKEKIDMVFGRFVKLDNFAQGTGLGLAICKSIVEQWGGRIGVESEQGKGSRFWFTHPYLKSEDGAEEPTKSIISNYEAQRPRILIAENTDTNYLLLSLTLNKEYDILRADNGEAAVRIALEQTPDLVLIDVNLSGIDGLEATRQIRQENPNLPIIAMTAFVRDQDRQKAIEAGCSDYMTKPIMPDILRKKLEILLRTGV